MGRADFFFLEETSLVQDDGTREESWEKGLIYHYNLSIRRFDYYRNLCKCYAFKDIAKDKNKQ